MEEIFQKAFQKVKELTPNGMTTMEYLRKEAEREYPPFTKEELEELPFKRIGGQSGAIYLLTKWKSRIYIHMEPGKDNGSIRLTDPLDKEKFTDDFLKNVAMRFICSGFECQAPTIYFYTKYIRPELDKEQNKKYLGSFNIYD